MITQQNKLVLNSIQFSCSVVPDTLRPHKLQHARLPCPSLSSPLLKLMSIESVIPSNHLILCCPLLPLPSIFPIIRVFSHESVLPIKWPKYWSFSFSISLSNEYSRLVSFTIDWLDLLAIQGTSRVFFKPQFKSINSLALSFLHSPTLTFIHDHLENHSLD